MTVSVLAQLDKSTRQEIKMIDLVFCVSNDTVEECIAEIQDAFENIPSDFISLLKRVLLVSYEINIKNRISIASFIYRFCQFFKVDPKRFI